MRSFGMRALMGAQGVRQVCDAAGARVVAEGVTTEEERSSLRGLGVGLARGPLLGALAPAGAWRQDPAS